MRVSFDVEVAPTTERPPDASVLQQPLHQVPAQYLDHLDVDQMGRVDDFGLVLKTECDSIARGCVEQKLHRR
jgi:hypothetical protein